MPMRPHLIFDTVIYTKYTGLYLNPYVHCVKQSECFASSAVARLWISYCNGARLVWFTFQSPGKWSIVEGRAGGTKQRSLSTTVLTQWRQQHKAACTGRNHSAQETTLSQLHSLNSAKIWIWKEAVWAGFKAFSHRPVQLFRKTEQNHENLSE
jgi:hypothetical protein